jgi:hypothetical protein
MPKAARDRIEYPGGEGFPRTRWVYYSEDSKIRTQPVVGNILDILGDIIDAIESADRRDYSRIKWTQISGLQSVNSQAPDPAAIVDFLVDKANSLSNAYCGAVRRRRKTKPTRRADLSACK